MPRRPRGVDDRRDILLPHLGRDAPDGSQGGFTQFREFSLPLFDKLLEAARGGPQRDLAERLDEDDGFEIVEVFPFNLLKQMLGYEESLRGGVPENMMHFSRVEIGEDRDRDGANRCDCKVGDAPVRFVFAQDRHPVAGSDAPVAKGLRQVPDQSPERLVCDGRTIHLRERYPIGIELKAPFEEGAEGKLFEFLHQFSRS